MHVCTCMFHHKWTSLWPRWQLRSHFDENSCLLSSAWSAYSTSSVILSMALWQGQLPWGKALATTPCNKAPQGTHQAKCSPKRASLSERQTKCWIISKHFLSTVLSGLCMQMCRSFMTRAQTHMSSRWMNMKQHANIFVVWAARKRCLLIL